PPVTYELYQRLLSTGLQPPGITHNLQHSVNWKRLADMPVPASHRLGHEYRVENRLFSRLDGRLEQRVNDIGARSQQIDLLRQRLGLMRHTQARVSRERDHVITTAVSGDRACARQSMRDATRESTQTMIEHRGICREHKH